MLSPIYRLGLHLTDCTIIIFFFFAFEARCPLYSTRLLHICHVAISFTQRAFRTQVGVMNP